MSSTTQTPPVITLYPSNKEDVNAYFAAIRLASSVRNSMEAEKAGVDVGKATVNADSYGRHHPNFPPPPPPPPPANLEPVPILNQTSSANIASNTTKPAFVHPRDGYPSPSHSMRTGIWPLLGEHASAAAAAILETLADEPTGVTLEALEQHHGHFPPPDPPMTTGNGPNFKDTAADILADVKPGALEQHHGYFPPPEPLIGSTQAPPGTPVSRRTGPIPIDLNQGPHKLYAPDGIPTQCQLYVANTDANDDTFAVCPITKRITNPTHSLASRQLNFGNVSNSHVLAIRNTAMCDAPTGFDQRVACGQYDGWFVLAFFILFCIMCLAWMTKRTYRTRKLDEEDGAAPWPRISNGSTNSSEAKGKPQASKVSTNGSVTKLREGVRKARGEDQRLDEELGGKQYEPVAWRSAPHRAARTNREGRVEHDAGPVAALPILLAELHAHHHFTPLAPRYGNI